MVLIISSTPATISNLPMSILRQFHTHLVNKNDEAIKLAATLQAKDLSIALLEEELKMARLERTMLQTQYDVAKASSNQSAPAPQPFTYDKENIHKLIQFAITSAFHVVKEGDVIWRFARGDKKFVRRLLTRVRRTEQKTIGYYLNEKGDEETVPILTGPGTWTWNSSDALPLSIDELSPSETMLIYQQLPHVSEQRVSFF
jgi:hypothetical protein